MTQQTSNPSQSMPLNPVLMGYPSNGSSQYQANYNYNSAAAAAYYHAQQQQQQQQVAQSPSQHHQAAVMSAAAAAMFNDNDQYPTYEDFQCIVQEYLDNLSPKKRDKALVDQHRYTLILQVLKDPRNTAISTAQFRFWVKKMFQLAPTDTLDIVCHDNKPVAMREQIYEILVRAHREAHHGGRDKTSALVSLCMTLFFGGRGEGGGVAFRTAPVKNFFLHTLTFLTNKQQSHLNFHFIFPFHSTTTIGTPSLFMDTKRIDCALCTELSILYIEAK
jgi:hypothetical protein